MKTVFLDNEPNWLKDFREASFNLAKTIIPETEINPLISTSKILYEDNGTLEILDINEAIYKNQEFFQKYFQDKAIFPHTERDLLINNAFFNSGLFIKVPKNVKLEIPLILSTKADNIVEKNIIVLEENSSLTIIHNLDSDSLAKRNSSLEVFQKENSNLNFIELQKFGNNMENVSAKSFVLDKNANLHHSFICLGSNYNKTFTDFYLNGENSQLKNIELFFGSSSQNFELNTNVIHNKPFTTSEVLIKGALKDSSRCLSNGMIRISKEGQKTKSFLSDHALILNPGAKADAIPGLEIEANDVQAGHSASVGQIDEDQLFYLMSRGLSKEEAKHAIITGFFNPVLELLSEELKETFLTLIKQKLVYEKTN